MLKEHTRSLTSALIRSQACAISVEHVAPDALPTEEKGRYYLSSHSYTGLWAQDASQRGSCTEHTPCVVTLAAAAHCCSTWIAGCVPRLCTIEPGGLYYAVRDLLRCNSYASCRHSMPNSSPRYAASCTACSCSRDVPQVDQPQTTGFVRSIMHDHADG
jgi:hypothetical protein